MKTALWRKAGFSLAAGLILLVLRLLQNASGFDPETALALPSLPGTLLIILLPVLLAAQLFLQRGVSREKVAFDCAFSPSAALKMPMVLGSMLLAAGGALLAVTSVTQNAGTVNIVCGVLGVAAGFGMILFAVQFFSGSDLTVTPVLPLMLFGVFLVLTVYLPTAEDPVLVRYYIPILASAAAACAFSQLAGFLQLESRPRSFAVTGNLAAALCIAALADDTGMPLRIFFVGCAVILIVFLLSAADQPQE